VNGYYNQPYQFSNYQPDSRYASESYNTSVNQTPTVPKRRQKITRDAVKESTPSKKAKIKRARTAFLVSYLSVHIQTTS